MRWLNVVFSGLELANDVAAKSNCQAVNRSLGGKKTVATEGHQLEKQSNRDKTEKEKKRMRTKEQAGRPARVHTASG